MFILTDIIPEQNDFSSGNNLKERHLMTPKTRILSDQVSCLDGLQIPWKQLFGSGKNLKDI